MRAAAGKASGAVSSGRIRSRPDRSTCQPFFSIFAHVSFSVAVRLKTSFRPPGRPAADGAEALSGSTQK